MTQEFYAVSRGFQYCGVGRTPIQAYQNARELTLENIRHVDEELRDDPNCQTVDVSPEEVWKNHIFPILHFSVITETAYKSFLDHQKKDKWYYTYSMGEPVEDPYLLQMTVWVRAWSMCSLKKFGFPDNWPADVPEERGTTWTDAFLACASYLNFVEQYPDQFESHDIIDMMTVIQDMYYAAFSGWWSLILDHLNVKRNVDFRPTPYEAMWNRKIEEFVLSHRTVDQTCMHSVHRPAGLASHTPH